MPDSVTNIGSDVFLNCDSLVLTVIINSYAEQYAIDNSLPYLSICKTHTWNEEYTVDKEATCTEEGSESIHCSVCGFIDESTIRVIEKKEHAYGDWLVTKEATCTEEGNKEKICTDCGEKTTEVIPALGHTWEEEYTVDKESTCTEEGSESIHCSICDDIEETTVRAIEKKDHIYGDWTVTKEATCTEVGSKEKVCTICGDKVTEEIQATGHNWNEEYTVDKEATCTEEGAESIHCSICGEIDERTVRVVPKKDHAYEDWTVTKAATCTEVGSREKVCADCGDKVIEAIPKKDHAYGSWTITKVATCTEAGSIEKICADCGDKIIEEIAATGHIWNEYYTVDKEATCTEEGVESIHCSVCNEIDETTRRSISANGHTWNTAYTTDKAATYTAEGVESIHCSICGQIKEGSQRKISKLPKPVSMLTISGITSKSYNGKAQTQAVVVKDGDTTLVEGTDYTVSYKNNTNAGTAYVIITGIGNYTNSVSKNFTIKKIANTITAKSIVKSYAAQAQSFDLGAKVKNGTPTYKSDNKSVTVTKTGKVTVKAKFIGNANITITSPASTNYTSATKTIVVKVMPTKTKFTSVTNSASKKMTLKWVKRTNATGYIIQYSTSSAFTSAKTVRIDKNTTVATTIGNLVKGKKYYVRIKTYRTVSGTKYYSGWSTVMSVKITK